MSRVMLASPQARALGLAFVASGDGTATLKAPYSEDLIGDPDTGVIAGGVVTTLLDHTCGQSVFAALDILVPIVTLDLRIDYMRPAKPHRDLIAHAHCYKITHSIAFVRAQAYEDDPSDPVATAQAAFMLNRDGGRPAGSNLPAQTVI
ncbi:MAG: PaaI family thioesterase [Caulobacteraceae bacterium]